MAKKPTLSVVVPVGYGIDEEKRNQLQTVIQDALESAGFDFSTQIPALKLYKPQDESIDPWSENTCPVCDEQQFVTIDHAQVECAKCQATFRVRNTAGDPGYVLDCFTDDVYEKAAKTPSLKGKRLYKVVKTGEEDREWLVAIENQWPVSLKTYSLIPQTYNTDVNPYMKNGE